MLIKEILSRMDGSLSYKKVRRTNKDWGLDFFRCLMMLFIVVHHNIVHGLNLYNSNDYSIYFIEGIFLNSLVVIGVNGFFLLSGYFCINFSFKKIMGFHFKTIFYGMLSYIFFVMLGLVSFDKIILIKSIILPELFYWYMLTYIIIIFFSKYINSMLEFLDKQSFQTYITILILLELLGLLTESDILGFNRGYSVIHGIFIYSIGFYISKYSIKISKRKCLFIYFGTCFINMVAVFLLTMNGKNLSNSIFSYNNPLIILGAVTLFYFFIDLKINYQPIIRLISFIRDAIIAVYLLTDHMGVQKTIYVPVLLMTEYVGVKWYWLCNILYSTFLFVFCILVDKFINKIVNIFYEVKFLYGGRN